MIKLRRFVFGRSVLKGVAIVYSTAIVAEVALSYNNITSQSYPMLYPLLALIAETVGVTLALRAAGDRRVSFLFALGIGIWLVGGTSVFVALQTMTDWLNSSIFVAASVLLGRLLLGTRGATPAFDLSLKGIVNARNSDLLGYRGGRSIF